MKQKNPATRPWRVRPTRVWRPYEGGKSIDKLRGKAGADSQFPEDWIGSVTPASNPPPRPDDEGLSEVQDTSGRVAVLADLVKADPVGFLGREAAAEYGPSTGVLVKLLDPVERLPVHAHPDRAFARRHLDSYFGKTEAWIVLGVRDAEDDPHVYLGLNEEVTLDEYASWLREQRTDRLLEVLHRLPVSEGDVVYVPAGVPHAIGPNLLIAEVQEPTDYAFLCEHDGYPVGVEDSYLGLPLEQSVSLLDLTVSSRRELESRCRIPPLGDRLLHGESDEFFEAIRLTPGRRVPGGRFVLGLVIEGAGELRVGRDSMTMTQGDAFAIPASADPWVLTSVEFALAFYGPRMI